MNITPILINLPLKVYHSLLDHVFPADFTESKCLLI